jgi:hypothetical protein
VSSGEHRRPLVLCGDWAGIDYCGVAHSERALFEDLSPPPQVVDPNHVGAAVRAVWRARRAGDPVVITYPTRSTVVRWRPLLTFAAAALLQRRRALHVHLHEYRVFRQVRWALDVILALGAPQVVVSSRSEAEAVARGLAGRLGRVHPVVIPPVSAVTPTTTGHDAVEAAGSGVAGVFGFAGPAKGVELVTEVVRHLPAHFHRLELVGRGWDAVDWPAEVTDRLAVAVLGFVPTTDVGAVFAGWELAIAPFSDGASDGRMSLRVPLAHGIPTLTEAGRPEDLTLAPGHLVVVDGSIAAAVDRAVARAGDRSARAEGLREVEAFEQRLRHGLREALVATGSAAAPAPAPPSDASASA